MTWSLFPPPAILGVLPPEVPIVRILGPPWPGLDLPSYPTAALRKPSFKGHFRWMVRWKSRQEEPVEVGSLCHYLHGFFYNPMQSLDGSDIPNNYKTLYVMGVLINLNWWTPDFERTINSSSASYVQCAMCNESSWNVLTYGNRCQYMLLELSSQKLWEAISNLRSRVFRWLAISHQLFKDIHDICCIYPP